MLKRTLDFFGLKGPSLCLLQQSAAIMTAMHTKRAAASAPIIAPALLLLSGLLSPCDPGGSGSDAVSPAMSGSLPVGSLSASAVSDVLSASGSSASCESLVLGEFGVGAGVLESSDVDSTCKDRNYLRKLHAQHSLIPYHMVSTYQATPNYGSARAASQYKPSSKKNAKFSDPGMTCLHFPTMHDQGAWGASS